MTISIIGYGRLGKVLEKLFSDSDFEIRICSSSQTPDKVRFFLLEDSLEADIVIPCLPISSLEGWLKENKEIIVDTAQIHDEKQIWLSVCSVMQEPKKWLTNTLGDTVEIVASHPLFGPMSTKDGTFFTGLSWIIEPHNNTLTQVEQLKAFITTKGIRIHDLSSEEHDRKMGYSQAVAFLFGKIGLELELEKTGLDTPGFEHVLANQSMVAGDSPQLFDDMFTYNEYAREMRTRTQEILTSLKKPR